MIVLMRYSTTVLYLTVTIRKCEMNVIVFVNNQVQWAAAHNH